jgi:hypothetical protein
MATKHKTSSANPKIFKFIASQSGTNAPSITILENTLGGEPVPSYGAVGEFNFTLAGVFSGTVVSPQNAMRTHSAMMDDFYNLYVSKTNNDVLRVATSVADNSTRVNGALYNTLIEVLIYP